MSAKSEFAEAAKLLGQELKAGREPPDFMNAVGETIAASGETEQLIRSIFEESHRSKPSEVTLMGYAYMLTAALDRLRLDSNGGDPQARRSLAVAQAALAHEVGIGDPSPATLMLVARAFADAELDPGRPLQDATMKALERAAESGANAGTAETDPFDHLSRLVGDDPFDLFTEAAAMAAAVPPQERPIITAALVNSKKLPLREAVLGFAMAADTSVSKAALAALVDMPKHQPVSSRMVERLVRIRPWVSPARQPGVDAAIRVLRPRAGAPLKAPRPVVVRVLASLCDGSGAQTLMGFVRQGNRIILAGILVKDRLGVADTWVTEGMRKPEANEMMKAIVARAGGVDISLALFERRLADRLCANLAEDAPPPFGLLNVLETLGIGAVHPEPVAPGALAEELLSGLPATKTDAAAVAAAHRESEFWHMELTTINSWYEAGDAVERKLQGLKTMPAQTKAMIADILPARRAFWAGQCAWTAAIQHASPKRDRLPWIDFALVARDLAGDRDLASIPLARSIAQTSALAFRQRPAEARH